MVAAWGLMPSHVRLVVLPVRGEEVRPRALINMQQTHDVCGHAVRQSLFSEWWHATGGQALLFCLLCRRTCRC